MDRPLRSPLNHTSPLEGNAPHLREELSGYYCPIESNEPLYKKIARFKALHQHLKADGASINGHDSYQGSILFRLANQIRNSLDLETILQTTVSEVRNLLHVDRCHFIWCLPCGDQMNLTITHESKTQALPSLLGDFPTQDESFLATAIAHLQQLRIDDVTNSADLTLEARSLLMRFGMAACLLFPLKTHSGQFGAILCSHCSNLRIWSDNEVELLQAVTDQVAIALDQAELLARARATALAAQTQADYLSEALKKLQQTQAQLVQHEKMSSLGQLVAGVAHEINNPVNFISGNITHATNYIQNLLELLQLYQECHPQPDPRIEAKVEEIDLMFLIDDLLKILSSMAMGTDRIRQIVLSLRNFSRLDEAEVKPVDIHEGIENTLLILKSRLRITSKGQDIRIVREYGKLPLVECYAGQLNQVFMNILGNAIDALEERMKTPDLTLEHWDKPCPPEEGRSSSQFSPRPAQFSDPTILIQTDIIEDSDSAVPHVAIRIRDNGIGMDESVKQKLFNPFFTTKPVGKGTGLGLSISYQIIVDKHNGILKCTSEPGHGTEFLIQIPIRSTALPT
ncbi:GAF domain-containing protein [Kovacikia minuta CCNUW1]|uniref:GAF domain-containing sensor histidine kinase n=1 Tax=Kovacikia minuta TaxID=2931930 RepID=UPI001CCF6F90|nr:ATP-binding protein [Kovacikia minuta]UBF25820.1 GAF domain-containing protein [Kovacikia minuta CCNUW1]